MIRDHKDLIVWQKSMDLLVEVYRLVKKLPKEESYVLSDQMRRAVIPSHRILRREEVVLLRRIIFVSCLWRVVRELNLKRNFWLAPVLIILKKTTLNWL